MSKRDLVLKYVSAWTPTWLAKRQLVLGVSDFIFERRLMAVARKHRLGRCPCDFNDVTLKITFEGISGAPDTPQDH